MAKRSENQFFKTFHLVIGVMFWSTVLLSSSIGLWSGDVTGFQWSVISGMFFISYVLIKGTIKPGSVYYFPSEKLTSNDSHYFVVINLNPFIEQVIILISRFKWN